MPVNALDESREEDAAHYWSYRALLEDKKRCLTLIPQVKHTVCNSLQKDGLDAKVSYRALDELKRHLAVNLNKKWDPNGFKTPPHAFISDENQPHFSQKDLAEKKKRMQTQIRRPASARAKLTSTAPSSTAADTEPAVDCEWNGGKKRSQKDIAKIAKATANVPEGGKYRYAFEAPTMNELMKPGNCMDRRFSTERAALAERRDSTTPHFSHEALTWKKKFHASKIHARTPQRSQSARELGGSDAGGDGANSAVESDVLRDPYLRSYQGDYPNGTSSEAWPNGRDDPKKPGRYRSQAYLAIDKRRHAANIDGDIENQRAKSRDDKLSSAASVTYDEQGFIKPDFTASSEKYRSQRALAQHKRRHLANLKEADDGQSVASPRFTGSPNPQNTTEMNPKEGLFTSYKSLDYGKRGHVVSLNSARDIQKVKRAASAASVGESIKSSESNCDVGKGISAMMARHIPGMVHTSQVEFHLKKKNHATGVFTTPRPDNFKDDASEESINGANALIEKRRASNPHNSCKAFALKKKYHQTGVHVKPESRLHPEILKVPIMDNNSAVMNSQKTLHNLKKKHMFEYDPDVRVKPGPMPIPNAPVPRNGQWTPQHVCD